MSLESKIELLTQAVTALTEALKAQGTHVTPAQVVTQAPAAPVVPAVQVAAPQVAQTPAPVTMPAPPTFAAAAPAAPVVPAGPQAPFSDVPGMIQYVMSAYQSMGPEKGAKIQGVLSGMGYSNINDVKPEHFGNLYQGVEALKAA